MINRKTFTWEDEKTWPSNWPREIIGETSDWSDILRLFTSEYSHISLYHACRPTNIDSYYDNGILVSNFEDLRKTTLPRILSELGSSIDPSDIEKASRKFSLANNKKVCLVVDYSYVISNCSHYLSHGSEYINIILSRLDPDVYRVSSDDLKKIGKPTIFQLVIPLKKIEESAIYQLVREIANAIAENNLCHPLPFTIAFDNSVEPKYIVKHFHPKEIE